MNGSSLENPLSFLSESRRAPELFSTLVSKRKELWAWSSGPVMPLLTRVRKRTLLFSEVPFSLDYEPAPPDGSGVRPRLRSRASCLGNHRIYFCRICLKCVRCSRCVLSPSKQARVGDGSINNKSPPWAKHGEGEGAPTAPPPAPSRWHLCITRGFLLDPPCALRPI